MTKRLPNRRGYTLAEMMISLVIMSIILLGSQAAVMVSSKAIPDGRSNTSLVVASANTMDTFSTEIMYALSFSVMSANTVEFMVADRDKDGQPETIRYSWSGTAGTPLTRTYNGGTPVTVASKVQQFQLAYDKRATPLPATVSEGSETLLAYYDSAYSSDDQSVKSDKWPSQYFVPNLPGNTVSWRISRLWVQAKRKNNALGQTNVQIRPMLDGVPSTVVYDEVPMMESNLSSSYQWVENTFSNAGPFGPSASICFVLKWISDSESCQVQYRNYSIFVPSNYMITGKDGNWGTSKDIMQYYVLGYVSTPNPISYTYNLTGVRCSFNAAGNSASTLNTTVRILNEPTVAGP